MQTDVAQIRTSGVTEVQTSTIAVRSMQGISFRSLPVAVFASQYCSVKNSSLPKPSAARQSPDYIPAALCRQPPPPASIQRTCWTALRSAPSCWYKRVQNIAMSSNSAQRQFPIGPPAPWRWMHYVPSKSHQPITHRRTVLLPQTGILVFDNFFLLQPNNGIRHTSVVSSSSTKQLWCCLQCGRLQH